MKLVFWTPALVEKLTDLWASGMPCSAIGEELGCTRNAVIGKAHRMGLQSRSVPPKKSPRPRVKTEPIVRVRKPTPPKPILPEVTTMQPEPIAEPVREGVSFAELGHVQCKFPSESAPFSFCGDTRVPGYPYCATHCRVCYRQSEERIRTRPFYRSAA